MEELKKRARVAGQLWEELRQQMESKTDEIMELQKSLEGERRAAKEAQEQNQLLQEANNQLTDAYKALGSDFSSTNKQVSLELAHFQDIRKSLGSTLEAYNRAVATLESRVLAAAHRLKELEAAGQEFSVAESTDQKSEESVPATGGDGGAEFVGKGAIEDEEADLTGEDLRIGTAGLAAHKRSSRYAR